MGRRYNYLKENILPLIKRIDNNYRTINNVVFLLNNIIVGMPVFID